MLQELSKSSQPRFENPGGSGGFNQAGDADGQAGLDVHALGQGQWEADARSHAQPVVDQGSAADHTGCSKHVTEPSRGDHQVLQHSAARRQHSACSSAISHRCFASRRQDVSNPAPVVASECVASSCTGRLRPARAKRNPAELRVHNMIRALS